ncbi:uncharacterized protein [Panulirus ornatus]|uniref:uncharacterized protein n=1 Tax=Panulirus ornatus TaxID=150431 RepID=UPI003A8B036F
MDMSHSVMVAACLVMLLLPVESSGDDATTTYYHLVPEHKSGDSRRHSNDQGTLQGGHPERHGPTKQEAVFPYSFEKVAMAAQERRKVAIGMPYAIKKEKQAVAAERFELNSVVNSGENLNLPAPEDLIPRVTPQRKRPLGVSSFWPSRPPTKTELDFVGILAAIAVKLILSTALSTWFLAAGQALYSVASFTGSTDIFGMDSAIKFIYKTVPFVEALLRGEDMFT